MHDAGSGSSDHEHRGLTGSIRKLLRRIIQKPSERPRPVIITSRRLSAPSNKLHTLTILATITSLAGYIAQFLGLRFLHYSVTLFQLVATAIMVVLRTWTRRNMVSEPKHDPATTNYELEVMAKSMAECEIWNIVSWTFGEHVSPTCVAADVLDARRRLGVLSQWPGPCEELASKVTDAIEVTMDFFSSHPDAFVNQEKWGSLTKFEWKLLVEVGVKPDSDDAEADRLEEITLNCTRQRQEGGELGPWKASKADMDCILGLWMLSFVNSRQPEAPVETRALRIFGLRHDRTIIDSIREPQTDMRLLDRQSVNFMNPAQYTVGLPLIVEHANVDWLGAISTKPVENICGQLILNELIFALAKEMDTTRFIRCGRSGGSNDTNHPNILSKLFNNLTQTGLVNAEEAYLCVVHPLSKIPIIAAQQRFEPSIVPQAHIEELGAPLNGVFLSHYEWSRLHWSIWAGSMDAFQRISLNQPEPTTEGFFETAIRIAAINRRLGACQKLAGRYDCRFPDERQLFSPFAAFRQESELIAWLLRHAADIETKNIFGNTPLHFAASGGHEVAVQLLVELGADRDAKSKSGDTPLHLAAFAGHEAVVRLLVELGADRGAKSDSGITPLHAAACVGHEAVVRLLVELGTDRDAKTNFGTTPLHSAAHAGHEAVVRLLVELGADRDAMNNAGTRPLLSPIHLLGRLQSLI